MNLRTQTTIYHDLILGGNSARRCLRWKSR